MNTSTSPTHPNTAPMRSKCLHSLPVDFERSHHGPDGENGHRQNVHGQHISWHHEQVQFTACCGREVMR